MGTSILTGILWDDWRLLQKGRKIAWNRLWDYADISLRSRWNSKMAKRETEQFDAQIKNATLITDPLFILGHWRSGTTLVHNYLCQDERFSYANLFQVYNPHTFLYLLPKLEKKLASSNKSKRPMDNVKVSFDDPAEDEFALAIASQCSPLLGWVFPHHWGEFTRFLEMNDVDEHESARWEWHFLNFFKKITLYKHGVPVLKSPQHTARIKHLLRLFPNAKFIHVYRNPYRVFQSMKRMYESTLPGLALQKFKGDFTEHILTQYRVLYDNYLDNKELVEPKNMIEMPYEDFISNPIAHLKKIYDHLSLPEFDQALPGFIAYQKAIANYEKNSYAAIAKNELGQINRAWERFFEEWNYRQI